jgi:hypothetical protein
MSVAPAEPLGDRTTKFAFELNEVSSMLWTILNTCSYAHGRALTADKVFRLILLALLLGLDTIF